jgi:hypothetical protein
MRSSALGLGHGQSVSRSRREATRRIFDLIEGQIAADPGMPAFILAAPEATWARFLEPVPPRHHHGIFAMMYRLPEFSIQGAFQSEATDCYA